MSISFLRTRAGSCGWLMAAWSCVALLLSACGGGMDTGLTNTASGGTGAMFTPKNCPSSSCAPAVMTLTDAKGDFLSYIVTLTSLQLQTANGTSVETLPAATKIDFAQLVNLTEVLSAGQIPTADYVSAKLTLDYTNANITADDGTGKAVVLKPVDVNGTALTGTLALTVQLDNSNHLVITSGRTGRLALDFNLAASNTVDLMGATVQVTPTLVATVVPSDIKRLRVRGQLASANAAQNDFVLNVQPFHQQAAATGQLTTRVTSTTTYQINGTAYTGTGGIMALAALPAGTMVAAFGTLQTGTQQTFTASSVLAGTSLENPADDQIAGTVIARNQTTLTVRGATWSRRDGDFDFETTDVMVTVGANTVVTEEGKTGAFSIADISVGQRIEAFGMAIKAANDVVTLDATAGHVRLDITPAWGVVTNIAAGNLTLNLQSIGGLAASVFTFAGTGTATGIDAKATAYVVNTGTLNQAGLTVDAPVRVFGFVTPFGTAPPDFTAETMVNLATVTADLVVDWGRAGSTMAFTGLTATSTSLKLDLANAGNEHVVRVGPQRVDLTTLATAPTLAPSTAAPDVFTIGHAGTFKTENFNTFPAFVTQLAKDLNGTTSVIVVAATGQYDSATNTFTANRIAVGVSN